MKLLIVFFLLSSFLNTTVFAEDICEEAMGGPYASAIRELAEGYLKLEYMQIEKGSKDISQIVFKKALDSQKKYFIEQLGLAKFEALFEKFKYQAVEQSKNSVATQTQVRQQSIRDQADLAIWELDKKITLSELKGTEFIRISPDQRFAITASLELIPRNSLTYTARIWDLVKGVHLFKLAGHVINGQDLNFSPDGKWVVMTDKNGRIPILYDALTGEEALRLKRRDGHITTLSFSPNGRFLVTGTDKTSIYINDLQAGKQKRFDFAKSAVRNVIKQIGFSADGSFFHTFSTDGAIRFWNVQTGENFHEMTLGHEKLTFSADGRYYYVFRSGDLQRRPVATHAPFVNLSIEGRWFSAYAVSDDNSRAVTATLGKVVMWDFNTGKELFDFKGHQFSEVTNLAFTHDGKHVISIGKDGFIRIWNSTDGAEVHAFSEHRSVYALTLGLDQTFVTIGGNSILIWKRSGSGQE